MRRESRPVIAVINSNDDLVAAVQTRLLDEEFEVVTAHIRDIKAGREDFGSFLRAHKPAVVIYDIAIPYDDNWTFLSTLRKLPESAGQRFVVTTVNKRALERHVGPTDALELVGGHADDFDPLIEAVRDTLRARAE